MKIIDSHVHFFDLSKGEYHWLKPENPPFWSDKKRIANNVSERDLVVSDSMNLAGFVHIEAGFNNQAPWQEIAWLEASCKLPFRAVANINLTLNPEKFQQQIKQISAYASVVGCRHILDSQAVELLTSEQVKSNFSALNKAKLNFEVQMPFSNKKAVNALNTIVKNNPNISFIINHAGSPLSNSGEVSEVSLWYQGLAIIAENNNVAIKCSGWEMVNRHYSFDWCKTIINHCLTLFGTQRVMLSSNFPLTRLSCSYQTYWQAMLSVVTSSLNECQHNLLHNNSKFWYKLP